MTNKLKYFIGNWKMFGDFKSIKIPQQIHHFCIKFQRKHKNNKIILCVPSILINFFSNNLKSNFVSIGAQNCSHNQNYGPYTGSTSAIMLKNAGAKYIILGHSENRIEGETNYIIKKKVEAALNSNLKVILCVGENLKEKAKGRTNLVLKKQLYQTVDKKFNLKNIIIAYEPMWSIGTGKIPTKNYLKKIFLLIKKDFKNKFKTKSSPKVLYGGSVNGKNINLFSSLSEIDGFLIGGASQSSKKFIDIIKNYYK